MHKNHMEAFSRALGVFVNAEMDVREAQKAGGEEREVLLAAQSARVELEDAFMDAVQSVAERLAAEARRDEW